ncbi:MarR family transcriptional regulator (plasmid) [Roseomonas sp. OT10]|uniref:MarR family winged helix-turn-helix transcriptional regulator n=1 Tax=Roseomonas cutis TaxID=2897332 RepID=UPI001E414A25|nr:MarR family transcriptional regulator [Roseomonas sp. OT10]UFN51756.1 MarR family transcriptional regulator [Roseomonas sp. OT10]
MQDEPNEHGLHDALPFDESAGFLIRDLNRAVQRELATLVQERGVLHGHWYFLRLLWQEDGLTQRELAQRLGMMEPTAVVALRGMEADGWIRRVRSETDKRKVHILLTPAGRRLREQLLPVARMVNERVLRNMSREEQLFFIALLRRARQNFGQQDPEFRRRESPASARSEEAGGQDGEAPGGTSARL